MIVSDIKNNNTNYNAINIFNPINDNILDLSKSITKTFLKHLQIML